MNYITISVPGCRIDISNVITILQHIKDVVDLKNKSNAKIGVLLKDFSLSKNKQTTTTTSCYFLQNKEEEGDCVCVKLRNR